MAKATSPLFAIEASGQVGKSIVYDRRGFVRVYRVPANPRTDAQGDIRTAFRAVSAVVKQIGAQAKADIAGTAEEGYRWNARIVSESLGKNLQYWNQAQTDFAALDTTTQGQWETAAKNHSITPSPVPYDQNPPANLPGLALFAVAMGYHRNKLGVGDPHTTSADDWVNYLTS